ncbi:MAG TPA: hypothetical protein VIJ95_18790 [Hanamia sp.]
MQKYLLHKQFTMRNEALSFSGCHWYVQVNYGFEPIENTIDSNYKRPDDNP